MIARPLLRLGLPKGRFLDNSLAVLKDLSCEVDGSRRSSWEITRDRFTLIIKLLKVQDITKLLQLGRLDLGVSADEWINECGVQLPPLVDLDWCITSIVLALPEGTVMASGRNCLTIATPYPNLTRSHFAQKGLPCRIMPITGATEALVPDICDGIVDCVETGQSLRDNRLRIYDVLLNSSIRLFARTALNAPGVEELCEILARHRKPMPGTIGWHELVEPSFLRPTDKREGVSESAKLKGEEST